MTVVLFAWITLLQHCRYVFFLDNEAAKGSLIAGSTSSETGSWLVRTLSVHEMRCQLKVWFARVSIGNNVADKPRRLDVTELVAEGASRVTVNWDKLLEQIQKYRSDEWGDG
jgi:hypothetical protein